MNAINLAEPAAVEVAGIEHALDALLRAALKADTTAGHDGPVSAAQLAKDYLARTPAEMRARQIVRNPVGEACRSMIRKLGVRLHEIGGQSLMLDVYYRVSELDARNSARRGGIIEVRWDGIGGWLK